MTLNSNNNLLKYKDIINLPHHVSKKHPQMSIEARSAQFAPFAALTGYEAAVEETGRLTDKKIEIDEEVKKILDRKLQTIKDKLKESNGKIQQKVSFTYFVPDLKKDGGKYIENIGIPKKIDDYKQIIILENKIEIPIREIIDILFI